MPMRRGSVVAVRDVSLFVCSTIRGSVACGVVGDVPKKNSVRLSWPSLSGSESGCASMLYSWPGRLVSI